jgi:hypothetical protein
MKRSSLLAWVITPINTSNPTYLTRLCTSWWLNIPKLQTLLIGATREMAQSRTQGRGVQLNNLRKSEDD